MLIFNFQVEAANLIEDIRQIDGNAERDTIE